MITRNNYEEFFLLYVDNELSPADRLAVERFVGDHPDLKEEWELLLQCRIAPDEITAFPGKEQLLKQLLPANPSLIDIHNYESWFLSYIDGELDEPARQAVIRFVRLHPEKSIELQRLQQTVNTPDTTIVFPDKESLYRKKEKRKIAWMPFARIAAAALVVGAIGLLIFHPFRRDTSAAGDRSLAGQASQTRPAVSTPSVIPHAVTDTPAATIVRAEKKQPDQPIAKNHTTPVTPRNTDTLYLKRAGQTDDPTPVLAKVEPPVSDKPLDAVATTHLAVMDAKVTDRPKTIPVTSTVLTTTSDLAQNNSAINTSFATQALLNRSDDTDGDDADEPASPRKNKLRGIFRKVTRSLEKPAAREEDNNRKVLIGGFQFALK